MESAASDPGDPFRQIDLFQAAAAVESTGFDDLYGFRKRYRFNMVLSGKSFFSNDFNAFRNLYVLFLLIERIEQQAPFLFVDQQAVCILKYGAGRGNAEGSQGNAAGKNIVAKFRQLTGKRYGFE